jgi:hypothetical protein
MQGLKIDRRSLWSQLTPQWTLAPESRFEYPVLQLVSAQKPGVAGNQPPPFGMVNGFGHAWVRLIDPNGGVISIGFYPDEAFDIAPERQPGLCMPGMLLHPDKYDRIGVEQLVTTIKLSELQFVDLLKWVEALQQKRWTDGLPFSLTYFNCVEFVAQVASRVGIVVPAYGALMDLCSALGPRPLRPLCRLVTKTPRGVRRKIFNQALCLLGGTKVECRLAQPKKNGDLQHAVTMAKLYPLLKSKGISKESDRPLWHIYWLRQWQKNIGNTVLEH